MKTRHYPVEDDETETTWSYNLDDSISQVIDPRGAITANYGSAFTKRGNPTSTTRHDVTGQTSGSLRA
jgi:hypothetical protein